MQDSTILVGTVSSRQDCAESPIVVAAYSDTRGKHTILHYTTLHELGPFELIVPSGECRLVAFADGNRNLKLDRNELRGEFKDGALVSAPVGGIVDSLDILLISADLANVHFPTGSALRAKKLKRFHSTSPGAVADLSDPAFSKSYGIKGYWTPLEFFREVGGNIYFIEEYDPAKIPVLFIHGGGGSPQDWSAFFERIDRSKYQPWFFNYPSGASLDSMAYLLFWKLHNLQRRHKFDNLIVTAHSMGGLVARAFLVAYGAQFPSITTFVSISTPWGGDEMAASGVKYSPAVIPSWIDLQTEGEFIRSLYASGLPANVDHYLFFGHQGNGDPLSDANDTVVTLKSQLDERSKQEARQVYGFQEDHVSILSSDRVLAQYNALLDMTSERLRATDDSQGNRVRVQFTFEGVEKLPVPRPALLLRPIGSETSDTWLYMDAGDSGQLQGPFPVGEYEASLIARAFVPEPLRVRVSIRSDSVPRVAFTMKPSGILTGRIADANEYNVQPGKLKSADEDLRIRTVTLRGDGLTRVLVPQPTGAPDYAQHYLSGTDFVAEGVFAFHRLPAGEYEITVSADGYHDCSARQEVRLGQAGSALMLELRKQAVR